MLGHADDLRMGTVGGDAIANGKAGHALAHIQNHAGVAVAQGQGLIEPGADRLDGGQEAIGADLVQHLGHPLGLGPGLAQQTGLAELDEHALGAGGDQATACGDEEVAGATAQRGDISDFSCTGC